MALENLPSKASIMVAILSIVAQERRGPCLRSLGPSPVTPRSSDLLRDDRDLWVKTVYKTAIDDS